MRIGILTFHSALNYGAVLQTYATARFLQSLGHEAFVVDYRNPVIARYSNPFSWSAEQFGKEGVKYMVKYPFSVCLRIRRRLVFNRFVHRRLQLCSCAEAEGLDLLLVGSDQLWNKQLTKGEDSVYFGKRFPNVRKMTWAVSAGETNLDPEEIRMLGQVFEAISVREQSLADKIPQSVLLPDPTLLLSPAEWEELVRPVSGKYVLAYPLRYEREVMETAERKAREMQLELKVISPFVKLGSSWIQMASPEEFISLIHGAAYVVTSSFHGAAFSLMFDRPHTFVHHGDPRFETLVSSDFSRAADQAKEFLCTRIP